MSKNSKKQNEKIRILVWADTPRAATGFATVSRNIFKPLAETGEYDITILGVNESGGWYDMDKHPYKIFPALPGGVMGEGDVYGRSRLIRAILGRDKEMTAPWDIIFTLNDPFIMEQPLPAFNAGILKVLQGIQKECFERAPEAAFKIVSYWPIDGPVKPNWISNAVAVPDYPVAYTEYGKKTMVEAGLKCDPPLEHLSDRMEVIYHGANQKDFYELPEDEVKEFREEFFTGHVSEDTFIVSAVARNQMRKDLPRTMRIFREFQKRRPDSFLYLHAKEQDVWGSLREYAKWFDLDPKKDWSFPGGFSERSGYPLEILNKIYNVSDVLISTTLGEGFGLPFVEAMATKTLNLSPCNTVVPELFNLSDPEEGETYNDVIDGPPNLEQRGVVYKSGSNSSEWAVYGPSDYERIRPLGNVDDAVEKLLWIYDNPEDADKIVDNAHSWVKELTWDNIAKEWDKVFKKAYKELKKEKKKAKKNLDSGKVTASIVEE